MIDYDGEVIPEPFPWPLLILLALYTPVILLKERPWFLLLFAYLGCVGLIVWAVKWVCGI